MESDVSKPDAGGVNPDDAKGGHRPASTKLIVLFAVVALIALILDVVTKWWALENLEEGVQHPLIGNFITLQLVFNPGAAFSLGESSTWIFTTITVFVIIAICWFATRIQETVPAVIAGLLLGGALGNLWDRLTQPPGFGRGHVVDFINYNNWFVGNVADIWIVVAAVGLVLWVLIRTETEHQAEITAKNTHSTSADDDGDKNG